MRALYILSAFLAIVASISQSSGVGGRLHESQGFEKMHQDGKLRMGESAEEVCCRCYNGTNTLSDPSSDAPSNALAPSNAQPDPIADAQANARTDH